MTGGPDYHTCHYGTSRLQFRGPPKRLRGDYIAFLGGSETFGTYIETPYPDLVEQALGTTCVNLGCQKAGIDSFLSAPSLLDICAMARVTVIQIMGAQNMSNRFFTVDPRRNNKFLRASRRLKDIYPEVDFSRIDTTDQLLSTLARVAPEMLYLVREEMQQAWLARMRTLLNSIDCPVVLLWAADHAPHGAQVSSTICREPLFVDRAMLDAVTEFSDHLVEVAVSRDEVKDGFAEMVLGPNDTQDAVEMLGPVAHRRIAGQLAPMLSGLIAPAERVHVLSREQRLEEDPCENIFAE
jgi:hypothetical protein